MLFSSSLTAKNMTELIKSTLCIRFLWQAIFYCFVFQYFDIPSLIKKKKTFSYFIKLNVVLYFLQFHIINILAFLKSGGIFISLMW